MTIPKLDDPIEIRGGFEMGEVSTSAEIQAGEVLVGGCGSVGSAVLGGIVEVRLTVGTKGKPIK